MTLQDVNRANAVDASDYAHAAGGRAGADDRQNGAHEEGNGASANGVHSILNTC